MDDSIEDWGNYLDVMQLLEHDVPLISTHNAGDKDNDGVTVASISYFRHDCAGHHDHNIHDNDIVPGASELTLIPDCAEHYDKDSVSNGSKSSNKSPSVASSNPIGSHKCPIMSEDLKEADKLLRVGDIIRYCVPLYDTMQYSRSVVLKVDPQGRYPLTLDTFVDLERTSSIEKLYKRCTGMACQVNQLICETGELKKIEDFQLEEGQMRNYDNYVESDKFLCVGDTITFYDTFWGSNRDMVTATVLKIDPNDDVPLKLDHRYQSLESTACIQKLHKWMGKEKSVQYIRGRWKEIHEFELEEGMVADFYHRKSAENQFLQQHLHKLEVQAKEYARKRGVPDDLVSLNTSNARNKASKARKK